MAETREFDEKEPGKIQAESVNSTRRPAETMFLLRHDEFLILSEGTSGKERAGKDLYLGFFVGGLIGLIGLVTSVEWEHLSGLKMWIFGASVIVLVALVAWSVAGVTIHLRRLKQEDNPESRLKKKISDFFQSVPTSIHPIPSIRIVSPHEGGKVSVRQMVRGKVQPPGHPLQIFVGQGTAYTLQGRVKPAGEDWEIICEFGSSTSVGGTLHRVVAIDGMKTVGPVIPDVPDGVASSQIVNVIRD